MIAQRVGRTTFEEGAGVNWMATLQLGVNLVEYRLVDYTAGPLHAPGAERGLRAELLRVGDGELVDPVGTTIEKIGVQTTELFLSATVPF